MERICDGEIRQDTERYSLDVSMRSYLRRIFAKTAVLITASMELGAEHGEASPEDVQRFRRIGYNLGMGFQVVDDLLDFTGTENRTGKPLGRDLSAGIFTAPERIDVIHYSALPWFSFTGLTHPRNYNDGDSIPKISFGRIFEQGGRMMLPLSILVHHGLIDGYHVGLYIKAFRQRDER